MQLGMIGLGRMGGNMAKRLEERGHDVKTFDPQVESTAKTLAELRDELSAPRTFWMMVPAGEVTEQTFQTLVGLAEAAALLILAPLGGAVADRMDRRTLLQWTQSTSLVAIIGTPSSPARDDMRGMASISPASRAVISMKKLPSPKAERSIPAALEALRKNS